MKDSCIIKSMPHGILLMLNPDIPFADLCTDVCRKFHDSSDFFGESILIIAFSGRDLSVEEEEALVEAVELNSRVKIRFVYESDMVKDKRMLGKIDRFYVDERTENARIHRGNVRKGELVTSEASLLILGDVEEGGSVSAKGSVSVLGCLAGKAATTDPKAFVAAAVFDNALVTIANISGDIHTRARKRLIGKDEDTNPVYISLNNGELTAAEVKDIE